MGVPLTFFDKYNPDEFDIIGITDRGNEWGIKTKEYTAEDAPNFGDLNRRSVLLVNGVYKMQFPRLLIRKRK